MNTIQLIRKVLHVSIKSPKLGQKYDRGTPTELHYCTPGFVLASVIVIFRPPENYITTGSVNFWTLTTLPNWAYLKVTGKIQVSIKIHILLTQRVMLKYGGEAGEVDNIATWAWSTVNNELPITDGMQAAVVRLNTFWPEVSTSYKPWWSY